MTGTVRGGVPARPAASLLAAAVAVAAFLAGFVGVRLAAGEDPVAALVERGAPDLAAHDAAIARVATEFGLDADLLRGLVAAESGGRAGAVSRTGAVGLLQLMPATAREQAKALRLDPATVSLSDPDTNLRLGARYFARLLADLGGEEAFALAAYNAGKANVLRWRSRAADADAAAVIHREAFGETRHHVRRALAYRDTYRSAR